VPHTDGKTQIESFLGQGAEENFFDVGKTG
jgi:hypothetical protein